MKCFWYIDSRIPKEQQKIEALCMECHKTHNFGWFCSGKSESDVVCAICKSIIYKKENDEAHSERQ